MSGLGREELYRRRTAKEMFRQKTIVVSDLLDHRLESEKSVIEFPKLVSRRRPLSGGNKDNAWTNPDLAVRQLSFIAKTTPKPKYYPLGLWQHQHKNNFPSVYNDGSLTPTRRPLSAGSTRPLEKLPLLEVSNRLIARSLDNENANDEASDGESTAERIPPWERPGMENCFKAEGEMVLKQNGTGPNIRINNVHHRSDQKEGDNTFTDTFGDENKYFTVSQSDFDLEETNDKDTNAQTPEQSGSIRAPNQLNSSDDLGTEDKAGTSVKGGSAGSSSARLIKRRHVHFGQKYGNQMPDNPEGEQENKFSSNVDQADNQSNVVGMLESKTEPDVEDSNPQELEDLRGLARVLVDKAINEAIDQVRELFVNADDSVAHHDEKPSR